MRNNKKIAYGGLLLAVNIILLFFTNIAITNRLFVMGIASLMVFFVIVEWGLKTGVAFFIASTVLSFLVMPDKILWISYTLTFSLYGIVKYIIETRLEFLLQYIIKLVFANIVLFLLYYIFKSFIYVPVNIVIIVAFEIIFLVYDYVYTLCIVYYFNKIRKNIFK